LSPVGSGRVALVRCKEASVVASECERNLDVTLLRMGTYLYAANGIECDWDLL